MAIENSVLRFFIYVLDSIDVFDCRLPGVLLVASADNLCNTVWNQIRPDVLSVLVLILSV